MNIHTEPKFKVGDVVIMLSGGPLMTVEDISQSNITTTVWFDKAEVRRDSFDSISLVKVK